MAKKFNFDKKMENDANNVIEEILQADFPLPEQAEAAKNEAFAKIREMAAASERQESTKDTYSEENRNILSRNFREFFCPADTGFFPNIPCVFPLFSFPG